MEPLTYAALHFVIVNRYCYNLIPFLYRTLTGNFRNKNVVLHVFNLFFRLFTVSISKHVGVFANKIVISRIETTYTDFSTLQFKWIPIMDQPTQNLQNK